jgi:hypothetical protein
VTLAHFVRLKDEYPHQDGGQEAHERGLMRSNAAARQEQK